MPTLLRLIKFAWQDFWRNLWLSAVTILMIVLALLSVNTLILFNVATERIIAAVEQNIDIVVFLKPEVSTEQAQAIVADLEKNADAKEVHLVTAEQALQEFQLRFKDNPTVLATLKELDGNPLGARVTVQAKEPQLYPAILASLDGAKYKDTILKTDYTDYETMVTSVNALTSKVRRAVLILFALFALVAILIVYNTIRVSIYTHRDEINVMKLVGASNIFVRMPFVFVSLFYTVIATVIALFLLYVVLLIAEPQLRAFFEGINLNMRAYVESHWVTLGLSQFLVAAVLNMVSSWLAVSRYVRV